MPAGVTFQYYQIQYREVNTGDWATIGTDLFNKDVFAEVTLRKVKHTSSGSCCSEYWGRCLPSEFKQCHVLSE